jgi:hypothetical protein
MMADFKPFLDDFGFLPHEKGLEPTRQAMDSVVTSKIILHLKAQLDSRKKGEKLAAAWEVAHLNDKRLWPILKKNLFEETDVDILSELLSAFINNPHPQAATELSRFVFNEKRFALRKKAIWVLSHFESSREAVDTLRNLALTDPDAKIRKEAVFALGEINDRTSSETLAEILLTDEDAKVRQMAIWALGRMRGDYNPILRALDEDNSSEVRREAAWILGRNQVEVACDNLLTALKRENDQKVLEVILWSMAKIDAASLSKADFVLEEDFNNRIKAEYIWLLGRYGLKKEIKKIARTYPGATVEVKRSLIWSMSQSGLVGAHEYLRHWHSMEKDKDLKEKILWAIGETGKN